MFATHSLNDARMRLDHSIFDRINENPFLEPIERVRFPVGMFFIRGNRAGPATELVEQVVASYDYWNEESGKYLDMVFPGWGKNGEHIVFDQTAFRKCKAEVESTSRWRSTGETEVILLNYDYRIIQWNSPNSFVGKGDFSFDETIILPIEEMIHDGRVRSLDGFIQELIASARGNQYRSEESILWAIRDNVAISRGAKAIWEGIKRQFLGDFSRVYDELRPYVICDLREA